MAKHIVQNQIEPVWRLKTQFENETESEKKVDILQRAYQILKKIDEHEVFTTNLAHKLTDIKDEDDVQDAFISLGYVIDEYNKVILPDNPPQISTTNQLKVKKPGPEFWPRKKY